MAQTATESGIDEVGTLNASKNGVEAAVARTAAKAITVLKAIPRSASLATAIGTTLNATHNEINSPNAPARSGYAASGSRLVPPERRYTPRERDSFSPEPAWLSLDVVADVAPRVTIAGQVCDPPNDRVLDEIEVGPVSSWPVRVRSRLDDRFSQSCLCSLQASQSEGS